MKLEEGKEYVNVAQTPPAIDGDSSDGDTSTAKAHNNNLSSPENNSSLGASCGPCSFPVNFVFSLIQFAVYLQKLYQDSMLVATYYNKGNLSYLAVAVLCLVAPVSLYVVFLVGARLAKPGTVLCRDWCTNLIHGMLLIPWQIKGRAEVLHFTSQRICDLRTPTDEEQDSVETLKRQANVLEFFESFYASVIQLILQLYLLLGSLNEHHDYKHLVPVIVASVLPLYSVIQAVSRRDDGPLTGVLSTVGWSAFFTARTVALALGTYIIHGWMIVVCIGHVLLISIWVTSVAWREHGNLTCRRKSAVAFLVVTLFGIPSLAYWPIMFQLKERKRPLIFFLICVLENSALFLLWFLSRSHYRIEAIHEKVFVALLFGGMLVGCLFIGLYIFCKPKYTDEVVMHNMKVENANSYGIFFDFCDATLPLPSTDRIHGNLQRARQVEEKNLYRS